MMWKVTSLMLLGVNTCRYHAHTLFW